MQGTTDIRPDTRKPISDEAIAQAIAAHRANWVKWNTQPDGTVKHRNAARWDIEATLEAEIKHGRDNHRRATETGTTVDFLPRELAAMHALGALHQATIARRQMADQKKVVRAQWEAATDARQTDAYRLDWSNRHGASVEALHRMIRRRRRDWLRFLELLAVYRQAAKS